MQNSSATHPTGEDLPPIGVKVTLSPPVAGRELDSRPERSGRGFNPQPTTDARPTTEASRPTTDASRPTTDASRPTTDSAARPLAGGHSTPRLLVLAARRGIGAGALAAACAARAVRAGGRAALADFRRPPHPDLAAATTEKQSPPFRLSSPTANPPFAGGEVAVALGESADFSGGVRPKAAAVIFTYAERDLAAARLAVARLQRAELPFACVAAHTPARFPFLPMLRERAAKALGAARVIEAPEFAVDELTAAALAGQAVADPALAQAVNKLAKLAGAEGIDDNDNGNGETVAPVETDEADETAGMAGRAGEAVAAARRAVADVV